MSGRPTKWVLVVVLPLLVALYASYPPMGVVVSKERLVKKTAASLEEADKAGVKVGQDYVISRETLKRRWLPLARGQRDKRTQIVGREEDGSWTELETTVVLGRIKLGLDLAGGTELLYKLEPRKGEQVTTEVFSTIDILKQRINPGNIKEYRIQPVGHGRILIQVPRASAAEVAQLKRRLERMGRLELKLAVPRHSEKEGFRQWYAKAQNGEPPEDYEVMYIDNDPAKEFYLVRKGEAEITGRYLSQVYPGRDQLGAPAVDFQLNSVGAKKFGPITGNNIGWHLAIILDGVLKSAPVIKHEITNAGQITGDFSREDVNDMVTILRAGSLPMDIQLLQESTVGPQLGRDSIRQGLLALAVAGFLVVGFIAFYYVGCGLVADGALLMNVVLLVGVLSVLGAALTLPGMAGILLTVGMAVDANVLIFERIREESAAGKGVRVALRNGYERAFTVIVDANVTTLLTALILYMVGTGPVRGFAITLSFGILLSMFTALVVTRLTFETMIDKGWLKQFKLRALMGGRSIGFSALRKAAYVLSAVTVVIGMAAFFARGADLYDIDFTGGSLVRISLARPASVSEVRSRLAAGGFPDAEVQAVGAQAAGGKGFTDFGIRFKGAGKERIRSDVLEPIRQRLQAAGLSVEKGKLTVTADRRGLQLKLDEPMPEMKLRELLAGAGGDPFHLGRITTIVPTREDLLSKRLIVDLSDVAGVSDQKELWSRALIALSWVGLKSEDYTVVKYERSGDGALRLVLDRPIQRNLLAAELERREFSGVDVEEGVEESKSYVLSGRPEALERLTQSLRAGDPLRGVPMADIRGDTVSATLAKGFSEADVRLLFEKQDMSDVHIAALDLSVSEYRLNLSSEAIREKMRSMFRDLAQRTGGVTFTKVSEDGGQEIVRMALEEAMPLADVQHYVESADIGHYASDIIVNKGSYGLGALVSEVDLRLPKEKAEAIQNRIKASFTEPRPVRKVVSIGGVVAEQLKGRAVLAVFFASVIIVLYVAARFHAFRFGMAAVIALVHDILITAGLIALVDWVGLFGGVKINLAMLAAFLTIMGYSLNDTIVVFDRIRENMGILGRKRVSADLIDLSINQTLSRTVLTSMTTLMVVVVLCVLGGSVLRGLALTLIFGVVVGTYSSMFIASPLLLDWQVVAAGTRTFFRVVFFPVRLPFKLVGLVFGRGQ
ncbi:MAG: protein translocase subunit SecD [Planctomycetes bacterium]|nr:protein translocase subunit SecD [Planctomycetota bacterium]